MKLKYKRVQKALRDDLKVYGNVAYDDVSKDYFTATLTKHNITLYMSLHTGLIFAFNNGTEGTKLISHIRDLEDGERDIKKLIKTGKVEDAHIGIDTESDLKKYAKLPHGIFPFEYMLKASIFNDHDTLQFFFDEQFKRYKNEDVFIHTYGGQYNADDVIEAMMDAFKKKDLEDVINTCEYEEIDYDVEEDNPDDDDERRMFCLEEIENHLTSNFGSYEDIEYTHADVMYDIKFDVGNMHDGRKYYKVWYDNSLDEDSVEAEFELDTFVRIVGEMVIDDENIDLDDLNGEIDDPSEYEAFDEFISLMRERILETGIVGDLVLEYMVDMDFPHEIEYS